MYNHIIQQTTAEETHWSGHGKTTTVNYCDIEQAIIKKVKI